MSRPFTQESFERKFEKVPNGCWEWQAVKNQDGYGRAKRFGKLEKQMKKIAKELDKGLTA